MRNKSHKSKLPDVLFLVFSSYRVLSVTAATQIHGIISAHSGSCLK